MTDRIDTAKEREKLAGLAGFTPGPWKDWQPRSDESVPVRTDGLGITIAYIHQGAVTNARNNARLIAAAPDLLASTHRLLDALDAERSENERLRATLSAITATDCYSRDECTAMARAALNPEGAP